MFSGLHSCCRRVKDLSSTDNVVFFMSVPIGGKHENFSNIYVPEKSLYIN